jgi:hypothetical protein
MSAFLQTMPQVGSLEFYPRGVLEAWASKLNIPFKEAEDVAALSLRLQLYAARRNVADNPPWAGFSPPAPFLAQKWKKPALLAWMRFLQLETTTATGKSLTVKAMAAELSSFQPTLDTPVWVTWPESWVKPQPAALMQGAALPEPEGQGGESKFGEEMGAGDMENYDATPGSAETTDGRVVVRTSELAALVTAAVTASLAARSTDDPLPLDRRSAADIEVEAFVDSRRGGRGSGTPQRQSALAVGHEAAPFCLHVDHKIRDSNGMPTTCSKPHPCGNSGHILGHAMEFGRQHRSPNPGSGGDNLPSHVPPFLSWRGGDQLLLQQPGASSTPVWCDILGTDGTAVEVLMADGSAVTLSGTQWTDLARGFSTAVQDSLSPYSGTRKRGGGGAQPPPPKVPKPTGWSFGKCGLLANMPAALSSSRGKPALRAAIGEGALDGAGIYPAPVVASVCAVLQTTVSSITLKRSTVRLLMEQKFRDLIWRDFLKTVETYKEGADLHRESDGAALSIVGASSASPTVTAVAKPAVGLASIREWNLAFGVFQTLMVGLYGPSFYAGLANFHQTVQEIEQGQGFTIARRFVCHVTRLLQDRWALHRLRSDPTDGAPGPAWDDYLAEAREQVRSNLDFIPLGAEKRATGEEEAPHPKRRKADGVCRLFSQTGSCKFGAKCKYKH